MTSEYNIENFLKMYYIDSNIPMYLYEEGKCTSYVPEQTSLTSPHRNTLICWIQKRKLYPISQ